VALRVTRDLWDDASFDKIIYQVYVRSRIDAGLEELREGGAVPHAEVVAGLMRQQTTGEYWQS